jgi:hypothetical protein
MSFSVPNQPFLSHFPPFVVKELNVFLQLYYRHYAIFLLNSKWFLLFFLIEARNKSLKNEYLKDKPFYSIESLQNFLDTEYLENFRNRPLAALTGFTPKEVLNGSIPVKHRFSEQMALAKSDRITTNQTFDCNTCSADSLKE